MKRRRNKVIKTEFVISSNNVNEKKDLDLLHNYTISVTFDKKTNKYGKTSKI